MNGLRTYNFLPFIPHLSFLLFSLFLSWISSSKNCVNQNFVSFFLPKNFQKLRNEKILPPKAGEEKPLNLTSLFQFSPFKFSSFWREKREKKKHSPRSRSKETSLTDSRVEGGFSVSTGSGKGRKMDTEREEKFSLSLYFKKVQERKGKERRKGYEEEKERRREREEIMMSLILKTFRTAITLLYFFLFILISLSLSTHLQLQFSLLFHPRFSLPFLHSSPLSSSC